mmetsp:Transcript_13420/g.44792  ORF Transcript_13420/g.44792 Transcript_13420/m.44792 type:complete len:347 (+) Transcript_13420:66-1106(+)
MKFGAQIKSRVAALEAFISRDAFIDYDGLKRIIDDGMNESSKRLTWRREFHELYLEEIRRVRSFLECQAQGHFIADVFGLTKARVPLNVLLDFVELNKAGFDKITKKFDKIACYLHVRWKLLGVSIDTKDELIDHLRMRNAVMHRTRATRGADEASSLRHFCQLSVGTRESSSPWRCARSRSGSEARARGGPSWRCSLWRARRCTRRCRTRRGSSSRSCRTSRWSRCHGTPPSSSEPAGPSSCSRGSLATRESRPAPRCSSSSSSCSARRRPRWSRPRRRRPSRRRACLGGGGPSSPSAASPTCASSPRSGRATCRGGRPSSPRRGRRCSSAPSRPTLTRAAGWPW